MDISQAQYELYVKTSNIGDKLEDLKINGVFDILEEYIFKPLDRGAFEAFKKIDPADTTRIIETQMMSKMIDSIKREVESKINQGKLAKDCLLKSTLSEED